MAVLSRIRRHGTRRDRHDPRDHRYIIPSRLRRHLPRAVDLRPWCPPVYDQRHLNACSANAIAAAIWFDERRQAPACASPSRLFIYYNERRREGSISVNAPVEIRDGYRSVARDGACSEQMWPYRVERYRRRPPERCYQAAVKRRAIRYARIEQTLQHLKACLAEHYPFTAGFAVYRSFESREVRRTGIVPLPATHEACLGGHAMLVVGYADAEEHFIVCNSWGARWGDRGYCYLRYDHVLDPTHAWDFWTVRRV